MAIKKIKIIRALFNRFKVFFKGYDTLGVQHAMASL